jgi:hypothetical protein
MVLPASPNQISLKDIAEEKLGSSAGSGQYFEDISLKGLSVDSVDDFGFYNGDTLIGPIDYPGTPNSAAPYAMSEFHGYAASFWPASAPGSITTNETNIMDITANDESGSDVTACTVLAMTLDTSAKTLKWKFINDADRTFDDDGNSNDITLSTNENTISYNGTITSLEARMVYSNLNHAYSGGGTGYTSASMAGRSWAAHNMGSHMDGSSIWNNGDNTAAFVQKTKLSGTDGVYVRLPLSGTYGYKTMRTTTGVCSIGMFATTEDVGFTNFNYSNASIGPSQSNASIYWQIRANGTEVLTIYNKAGATGEVLVADTFKASTT